MGEGQSRWRRGVAEPGRLLRMRCRRGLAIGALGSCDRKRRKRQRDRNDQMPTGQSSRHRNIIVSSPRGRDRTLPRRIVSIAVAGAKFGAHSAVREISRGRSISSELALHWLAVHLDRGDIGPPARTVAAAGKQVRKSHLVDPRQVRLLHEISLGDDRVDVEPQPPNVSE